MAALLVLIISISSLIIAGYTIRQTNKIEKEFKETIRKAAIAELEKRSKQDR